MKIAFVLYYIFGGSDFQSKCNQWKRLEQDEKGKGGAKRKFTSLVAHEYRIKESGGYLLTGRPPKEKVVKKKVKDYFWIDLYSLDFGKDMTRRRL